MKILFIFFAAIVAISLIWRWLSNGKSIPCPAWLGWLVEMDNPLAKVSHAPSIIKHNAIVEGMTVLDAGCGPGRITIPVARQVGPSGKVVALDIQEGMLARVKVKAEKENLSNIEFFNAGLGEGILVSETFDRVVMVMVLGEIPNREDALRELFHSLKPDGLLSITETIFDPHFLRQSDLQRIVEKAGFKMKICEGGTFAYTMIFNK